MEALIYNKQGKESGKVALPETIFGLPWNSDLVHQVLVSMRSNERQGNASTKGRGDVRGGGKKPWQQKGTGRARHGSSRSPIWVGGGATHGPNSEKDYSRKVNKTMKNKALFTLLSRKWKDGELLFVDSLDTAAPKTKEAASALSALAKIKGFNALTHKTGKRALVLTSTLAENTVKSFRNLPQVAVSEAREINPLAVAMYKYVVITNPADSLAVISGRPTTRTSSLTKAAKEK